ncbi:MAG: hypothetical protein ACJ71P_17690, partial [Nitrososphaeraceae archaeon]
LSQLAEEIALEFNEVYIEHKFTSHSPIKKPINTLSSRLPLSWSFFLILMIRHHIFCIIL